MRAAVPFLDSSTLEWANPAPGIYSRLLSRDPETGERTALQRIDPADNYVDQPRAHFHKTTEEILVVDGMMSFDSRTWLHRGAYVFHPAEFVHGFRSTVPVETRFLSRVGRNLDFTYVDQPADDFPYFVGQDLPSRSLHVDPCPFARPWRAWQQADGRRIARWQPLSVDPVSGEGSFLFRYDADAREPEDCGATLAHYAEMFVLDGVLVADDGRRFSAGCYAFLPPGERRPRFHAEAESLVYVNVGAGATRGPVSSATWPSS
jgi:hypothetical protein